MSKSPFGSRDPIDGRLVRVAGQVEGVRRMTKENRDCVDVLTQLAAIRAALDQVGIEILAHHMRDCASGEGCRNEKGIEEAERSKELKTGMNRLLK